jgi:hypothetical protein
MDQLMLFEKIMRESRLSYGPDLSRPLIYQGNFARRSLEGSINRNVDAIMLFKKMAWPFVGMRLIDPYSIDRASGGSAPLAQ